jgi:hypothetical protein
MSNRRSFMSAIVAFFGFCVGRNEFIHLEKKDSDRLNQVISNRDPLKAGRVLVGGWLHPIPQGEGEFWVPNEGTYVTVIDGFYKLNK